MTPLESLKAKALAAIGKVGFEQQVTYEFQGAASPGVVLKMIERIERMAEALNSICLTYGHASGSIEDDYAHVYKTAREALKAGEGES